MKNNEKTDNKSSKNYLNDGNANVVKYFYFNFNFRSISISIKKTFRV